MFDESKAMEDFFMFDQGLLSSCDCYHDTVLDHSDIAVTILNIPHVN